MNNPNFLLLTALDLPYPLHPTLRQFESVTGKGLAMIYMSELFNDVQAAWYGNTNFEISRKKK